MKIGTESQSMVATLRQHLRREGWTARRLAEQFSIGEATAKRWMAGKGVTLDRIERMAALCGLTIAELARETDGPPDGIAHELTLAQERALSTDAFLAFVFMAIMSGSNPYEIATDFAIPTREIEAPLLRLERLALIDRLPSGRVRPMIDRTIVWRKGPMRALFETHMKAQFLAMDFSSSDAVYTSEIMKLSAQGAAMLAELIEKHRREVQELAEADRHATNLPRQWYTMLNAIRPLDTTNLNRRREASL